jgi:hypothetical protein
MVRSAVEAVSVAFADLHKLIVRLLENRNELLLALLAQRTGDCWCQMGIGNPMVREHSAACVAARKAIEQAEGREP